MQLETRFLRLKMPVTVGLRLKTRSAALQKQLVSY
jgi:hypothetical protein